MPVNSEKLAEVQKLMDEVRKLPALSPEWREKTREIERLLAEMGVL